MNVLRDRCEQLANFLREAIIQGDYAPPLPSTRAWCQQLGVGRPTLLRALQILASEGVISMTKRGAVLNSRPSKDKSAVQATTKIVRSLTHGAYSGTFDGAIIRLADQLQSQGVRLVVESCNLQRLAAIASQESSPSELCCLLSIPVAYQNAFYHRRESVLVMGLTSPESPVSYMTPDLNGSVRHATHSLLRQGFKRLVMFERVSKTFGVSQCIQTFRTSCEEWRVQPIQSDVHLVWNDYTAMRTTIRRFAAKTRDPFGLVVHAPVSIGILISALLQEGMKIPEQVSIRALEYREDAVQFSVPITHYQVCIDRYAKEVLHLALHYFERGRLRKMQKALPMTVLTSG